MILNSKQIRFAEGLLKKHHWQDEISNEEKS